MKLGSKCNVSCQTDIASWYIETKLFNNHALMQIFYPSSYPGINNDLWLKGIQ